MKMLGQGSSQEAFSMEPKETIIGIRELYNRKVNPESEKKEVIRLSYRDRYAVRKANGICTNCGKRKVYRDLTICKQCRDWRRKYQKKRKR